MNMDRVKKQKAPYIKFKLSDIIQSGYPEN